MQDIVVLFGALSVTVSDTVRLNIDRGEGGGGVHLLPTVSYLAGRRTAGRGEGLVADSVERRAPPRACRLVVASARFRQMSGGRARPAASFRGLLARSTAHSLPPLPGLWLVTACRSPSLHRHCRGPVTAAAKANPWPAEAELSTPFRMPLIVG